MLERIKKVLNDFVPINSELITPDAHLINDLGLNSFDVVNAVVAFEEEFNIEIADRDIRTLATVGDVLTYIEAKS